MLGKDPRGTLKRVKQFQVEKMRRQIMQIGSMVGAFERARAELEQEVKRLEHLTGETDPANVVYSILAKALMQRRANIKLSAIELGRQLDETKQAMAEALVELEESETAEQNRQVTQT